MYDNIYSYKELDNMIQNLESCSTEDNILDKVRCQNECYNLLKFNSFDLFESFSLLV